MTQSNITAQAMQILSKNIGRKFTASSLAEFLSSDPEAGTSEFYYKFEESLNLVRESEDSMYYLWRDMYELIVSNWKQNPHFEMSVYEIFQGNPNGQSSMSYIVRAMRHKMFMNNEAIELVKQKNSLGRFQTNVNGTVDWLRTVKELKGDAFFRRTENFAPFLKAGIITSSDLISVDEEISPEVIARMSRLDLKQHDLKLTYQVVKNLSRRSFRSRDVGFLSAGYRNASNSHTSYLYDTELHKMFFDEFGIEFYEVLLERIKELFPAKATKSTHYAILNDAADYYFSAGSGRFSRASYSFYETYKEIYSVQARFEQFKKSLNYASQEELVEWMSILTNEPKSDFEDFTKDWLLKMAEVFT